jgi:hypothetical protein
MQSIRLLLIAVFAALLPWNAQAQTAGPLLWSSFIIGTESYARNNSNATVVSRFTPGVAIVVTRIQLQAAQGSYISQNTKCIHVPKVRVTDGTTEYALAIPNARQSGAYPSSVQADSGPISAAFPANAELRLSVLPGDFNCTAGAINVNVQYTVP